MAENSQTTPSPQPLAEEGVNGSNVIVWTIGGDNKVEVIPLPPPANKQMSSTVINQSSTGVFELQETPEFIGQREDPNNVRARIAYSLLMVLTGLCLIAVGVYSEFHTTTPGGGVPFWVVGTLLLFPGLYCVWDSIHTYKQLQMTERQRIIKEDDEPPAE